MLWRSELEKLFPGLCRFDVPLSGLNSWGVGGPAECLITPTTPEVLPLLFRFVKNRNLPLWVLGGGTNVLIPDRGLSGVTVHTCLLNRVEQNQEPGNVPTFTCEAGIALKELLRLSWINGLAGLEFSAGIPGTLGGALIGNAGASGKGIGDLVNWVETIDLDGNIRTSKREDLGFSYRKSDLGHSGHLVTRCSISMLPSRREEIARKIREQMLLRSRQPHGVKTAGCVFKNPDSLFAGQLLESSGCKTLSCGPVIVSAEHANFFVNCGQAKASDVWRLILLCRQKVQECTGIHLELEVKLLGEAWQ